MMGLVDDDYQDALNSYGLGTNAEVNTVSQYMVPTGASNWDAVYRYLQGGLACTGTGWYAQYPGSGGAIGNFANLANGSGFQPIFIYYQIGQFDISQLTSATFMGEYYQDWEQFLIQINTWMTAHPGKVVTVDIEPDMFGGIEQGGGSPGTYSVSVASATKPSCTTPWVSLSAYPNTLAGYCQAMLFLKDQEMSAGNNANLKVAIHVSGWGAAPNPATTSGMSGGALSTHAGTIAAFFNACQPSSGSKFDLFFTDPSGYDGGYQSTYNWDTGGAMAQQYATWLGYLTTDLSLRCMLWQMPEGNSHMTNVLGHYKDVRPEYFLNDSPLNTSGYSHNICLYVANGCIGALWGPGDYHGTDVMDFFYPANYAGSASQQDGTGNGGAASWGSAVVDDDAGFFRTHIANNHTWGATCPLTGGGNTNTPTITNTYTKTATLTATATFTQTFTNTITKTFSPTVTLTATNTISSTYSSTATNTFTKTVTQTFTNTPALTATFTRTVTNTPTNTLATTATATLTLTNTIMMTPTFSQTVTNTETNTASNTPGGNTSTVTNTPSNTATPLSTNTLTHTATRTVTTTATNSITPTATLTLTNTVTNTPGGNTATITNTPTVTSTLTASATATRTFTLTYTSTPTRTFTLTFTNTSTDTATATATSTFTNTPTPQYSMTFTQTPTNTFSSTITNTPTPTFSSTLTYTNTDTPTVTLTPTKTWTPTVTFTPTITNTPTPTAATHVIYSPPYPNPVTNGPIQFDLITPPGSHTIELDVFTISFRKVVEHTIKFTGVTTTVQWDLKDRMGSAVADGLYYVRITVTGTGSSTKILKVMILK